MVCKKFPAHKFVTIENFEKFLDKNPEIEFRPVSVRGCPIAKFLRTKFSEEDFGGVSRFGYAFKGREYKTPKWITEFITIFDERSSNILYGTGVAKEILVKIKGGQ